MKELQDLKTAVCAVNKRLVDAVHLMEPIILLRNCGPDDRPFHSSQLFKAKIITKEEAKEFTKFVGGNTI